jgi:hypothetical protein
MTWVSTALAAVVLFTFQDEAIDESSAIVDGGDVVFTINDSGDSARVFVVDKASGQTIGETTYADEDPVDVEALAAGPGGTMWVGDIGDNNGERSHITVYRIPTPTPGDRRATPTAYELVYRGGPRDAEAVLVHPRTGRLYVVSKGLLGGTVYAAPRKLRTDRTNVLVPVGDAPGLVTDGVFFPDGKHVVVRDYGRAVVLRMPDFAPIAEFDLPAQKQGEGIGLEGNRVLVSSEGVNAPVLSRAVPPRVLRAMRPAPAPSPSPTISPEPPVSEQADEPWGGTVVPVALGAAWLVLGLFALTWLVKRRQSRSTT